MGFYAVVAVPVYPGRQMGSVLACRGGFPRSQVRLQATGHLAPSTPRLSTASPYFSSFFAPMPLMPCRSSSDCGVALGNGSQRCVVKDHIRGQVVLARHLGAPGLEVDEAHLRVRPQVGGSGRWCAAFAGAFGRGGRHRFAQLHRHLALEHGARAFGEAQGVKAVAAVQHHLLQAQGTRGDQLAQHAAQLGLGQVCANAEGGDFSCPNCATFSVFLPRRMSMMCPVPKLMPLAWCTR
jgi:hypothetical protein